MDIVFTGRKADLTRDLRALAEEKLGKLERILHEIPGAHVVLTREKHRHLVEIVVRGRAGTLTATADGSEFEESLARAGDRILAQARKHHSKIAKGPKRRRGRGEARSAQVPPASGDGAGVVSMGRIPVKPMSVEEAVLQLEEQGDAFVVFRDADSMQVAVIFRRRDGRIGLVEPET